MKKRFKLISVIVAFVMLAECLPLQAMANSIPVTSLDIRFAENSSSTEHATLEKMAIL